MHIEIASEQLFKVGGFVVNNSMLLAWVLVLGLVFLARSISKKMLLVPNGAQNVVELGMESWLNNLSSIFGSEKKAFKYFPFITTIFIFILFSNWSGLVPGIGAFSYKHISHGEVHAIPLFRAPSSDLNFTLGLALLTIISINIMGIRASGLKIAIKRYFNFSSPVDFFIGILELIGEFAKTISLSFRLFGNIFAGEVLLVIIGFLAPYIIPLPFIALEIFTGFIQALVFATLTAVFLGTLVETPHH